MSMPRRARTALIGAATGVVLLAAIWYAAHYIALGRSADASILRGFADLTRPRLDRVTNFIANLCSPNEYVFLAALPVIVALVRGRPRVAAMLAIVLLCANETHATAQAAAGRAARPGAVGAAERRHVAQRSRHRGDVAGPVLGDRRSGALPPGGGRGDGGVRGRGQLLVPGAGLALPVRRARRLPRRRHVDAAGGRRRCRSSRRAAPGASPRPGPRGGRRSRWARRWRRSAVLGRWRACWLALIVIARPHEVVTYVRDARGVRDRRRQRSAPWGCCWRPG